MKSNSSGARAALRQQLASDRLLGIKSIPVPLPAKPLQRSARSSDKADAAGSSDQAEQLRVLDESEVKACKQCGLSKTRTQTVFGQGNPNARLVFVGEAPGFHEDRQGLAFVGKAGDKLTDIIRAMGLSRDEVFICNVLKCRPPDNRDPAANEILACSSFLRRQIAIIQPEVMVALGSPAAKTLLHTTQAIGKLRGRFHDYFLSGTTGEGPSVPLMPTYHPAYLLRNPSEKRKTWADVQMVMARLGLT